MEKITKSSLKKIFVFIKTISLAINCTFFIILGLPLVQLGLCIYGLAFPSSIHPKSFLDFLLIYLATTSCFLVAICLILIALSMPGIFFYKIFYKKNKNFPLILIYLLFGIMALIGVRFQISGITDVLKFLFFCSPPKFELESSLFVGYLRILIALWHCSNFISFFYNKYASKLATLQSPYWTKFSQVKSIAQLENLYQKELDADRLSAIRLNLWSVYLMKRSQLSLKWRIFQFFF